MLLIIIIGLALAYIAAYLILAAIKNRNTVYPDASDAEQFGVYLSEDERCINDRQALKKMDKTVADMPSPNRKKFFL